MENGIISGLIIFSSIAIILVALIVIADINAKYDSKTNNYNKSNVQLEDSKRQKLNNDLSITDLKGAEGERYVNSKLELLPEGSEFILTNLLLPTYGGHKTEIDTVLVTKKGIFCIEIKNWIGKIKTI